MEEHMHRETGEITTHAFACSPSLEAIAPALVTCQGEIEAATKDKINPAFKSSYADLRAVREAIRAPLANNGLALVQLPHAGQGRVVVTSVLLHKSGEWIACDLAMPLAQATPHAVGSAISYARRYAAMSMLAVSAEDDDGNTASGQGPTTPHPEPKPAPKEEAKPARRQEPKSDENREVHIERILDTKVVPWKNPKGESVTFYVIRASNGREYSTRSQELFNAASSLLNGPPAEILCHSYLKNNETKWALDGVKPLSESKEPSQGELMPPPF